MAKLQAAKSGGLTPLFDALIFAADFIAQHRRAGVQRPDFVLRRERHHQRAFRQRSPAAAQGAGTMTTPSILEFPDLGRQVLAAVADAPAVAILSPLLREPGAAALLNTVFEDLRASYVVTYDLPAIRLDFHALRLLPRTISTLHSTAERVQLRTQRSLISDDGKP